MGKNVPALADCGGLLVVRPVRQGRQVPVRLSTGLLVARRFRERKKKKKGRQVRPGVTHGL